VLVFSRDLCILLTCAVLYASTTIRDFRPSIYGKINTGAQVVTIFFVLLFQVDSAAWIFYSRKVGLVATFVFTLVSGIHYVFLIGQRLRKYERGEKPVSSPL
jgi:cardiolipin synthase